MALPPGWKNNGDGTYSQSLPVTNGQGLNLELKSDLNGKQTIIDKSSGKVVFERNPGDKKLTVKDKNIANTLNNSQKTSISTISTNATWDLIQNEGSVEQKNSASESETYKSKANNGEDELSGLQQDALSPEPQIFPTPSNGSGRYQYPLEMLDGQDKIRFTACEIVPGKQSTYVKKDESIYIGIQGPISDNNQVKWGEGTLNPIEKEALSLAQSLISSGSDPGSATADAGKSLMEKVTDPSAKATIKEYLAGAAIGKPDVISRTAKKILNPNLELLFQSPALRTMQFSFKMSARDNTEAKAVKAIIKYFKRHMAVRKDTTDLFLKAPHVFTIQYLKGDNQLHQSIGKISPKQSGKTKACALLSCNVDYTPLGSYMTYNDSDATMVSYTINLSFQEIEPIYAEDYDDDHPIGF